VTAALGSGAGALLAAVLDRLIPSDVHGPGALAAGVPLYIAGVLERGGEMAVARWEAGLAALDALAQEREGGGFAALAPEAQDRVLGPAAEREAAFFGELRQRAIEGMFCDPSWGGNAGEAGWRLLGYTGPQHVWNAADQAIGEARRAP
jgi:gluconate 2-dehydrogenase gamma chain